MNVLGKISLRLRLTILMAALLTIICILLACISIFSARNIFYMPYSEIPEIITQEVPDKPQQVLNEISIIRNNRDFTVVNLICMVVVIILGTIATYIIAGKALKPVSDLSRAIESIDENNLFQKIAEPDTNDEISTLSIAFNNMTRKIEKAFTSQKNFSVNVAHELKTPIAAIISGIEVLQLDENPSVSEYKEVLDDTLNNAERLSELIQDMFRLNISLDLSACENFWLDEIFEDIVCELSDELENKNINIEKEINGISLYGEKILLTRAFSNIIHNAVKYNKQGGTIKISSQQEEQNISITISDTGMGIPQCDLEHIFDPFYCVDKSRSRELGGSGLGLSIVKAIIDKHHGTVKILSNIETGTDVTLSIPKL